MKKIPASAAATRLMTMAVPIKIPNRSEPNQKYAMRPISAGQVAAQSPEHVLLVPVSFVNR